MKNIVSRKLQFRKGVLKFRECSLVTQIATDAVDCAVQTDPKGHTKASLGPRQVTSEWKPNCVDVKWRWEIAVVLDVLTLKCVLLFLLFNTSIEAVRLLSPVLHGAASSSALLPSGHALAATLRWLFLNAVHNSVSSRSAG